MTENELKELKHYLLEESCVQKSVAEMAIQALEEIQQYRAIGTVEEIKTMMDEGAFTGTELAEITSLLREWKKYHEIGTIEEFKALKEKSVAKKAIRRTGMCYAKAKDGTDNYEIIEECPTCKKRLCAVSFNVGYCKCGQKITV